AHEDERERPDELGQRALPEPSLHGVLDGSSVGRTHHTLAARPPDGPSHRGYRVPMRARSRSPSTHEGDGAGVSDEPRPVPPEPPKAGVLRAGSVDELVDR